MAHAIAQDEEQLRRPLMVSAVGHAVLAGIAVISTILRPANVTWGGGGEGGAATIRLVSSASVPLPAPTISTQNRVATENRGLNYPEPPQAQPRNVPPPPPDPRTVDVPASNARVVPPKPEEAVRPPEPKPPEPPPPPRRQVATTRSAERQPPQANRPAPTERAANEIPFGEGGPVQGPFGVFQSEAGTGGISVAGGGGGEFGERYSWYVAAIRNRISGNWLKSTVDSNVRVAPRVFVTFQILRDGRVVNPQLTSSSGVSSLDRSALRAVMDSSPMPPLPPDYPGSNVSVEFWFDFRR